MIVGAVHFVSQLVVQSVVCVSVISLDMNINVLNFSVVVLLEAAYAATYTMQHLPVFF